MGLCTDAPLLCVGPLRGCWRNWDWSFCSNSIAFVPNHYSSSLPGGEPDVMRGRFEPGLRSSGGSSVELSVGGSS